MTCPQRERSCELAHRSVFNNGKGNYMNAIDFIKQEHDKVLTILRDLETIQPFPGEYKNETNTFVKLQDAMTLHSAIMEECFYPTVNKIDGMRDLIKQTSRANTKIEQTISNLAFLSPVEKNFKNGLRLLKKDFEAQARLEELQMFPIVEQVLSKNELDIIGLQMEQIKNSRIFATAH